MIQHGFLLLFCALWVHLAIQSVRTSRSLVVMDEIAQAPPGHLPRLSVVIAACNEGTTLRGALETLLRQDYPELELIVVNDRSTDDTGPVLEALARDHPQIKVLRIDALPVGWLGKVHALQRGLEQATGDWVLFTDADVHFDAGVLARAVAYVVARRKDHLVIIPKVTLERRGKFWLNVAVTAFGGMYLHKVRALDLEKPGSDAYAGAGGFNLVRREALAQTPGFEWLRMEVADDVGLGLMLKRAGFTTTLAVSTGAVSVAWYNSLGEMFQGLEKNSFLFACGASVPRLAAMTVFILAYLAAPWAALADPSVPIRIAGGLVLTGFAASAVVAARRFKLPLVLPLLAPFGLILVTACLWRSAFACLRQGGIYWRGSFYPLAELKRLQRVRV